MNKSQTELINYAVMPRLEMEIALTVYDTCLSEKALTVLLSIEGNICSNTSDLVSRFGIYKNLHQSSVISKYNFVNPKSNVTSVSKEIFS